MKLTEQQKERYIDACTSAICRCLIPNVTKVSLSLKDIEHPTLSVYTRGANNEDDFHLDVVLTDTNSMHLYFKQVQFLYGEAILGIALQPSIHCCNHIRRAIYFVLSGINKDYDGICYDFSAIPGYNGLTIDTTNWYTFDNVEDLRFAPMDLDRILHEDGE